MFGEVTRGFSGTSSVTLLFLFILREIWLSEEYLVFPGCGVGSLATPGRKGIRHLGFLTLESRGLLQKTSKCIVDTGLKD